MPTVSENIKTTLEKIRKAEKESGRKPGSVKLVAVSKTKPVNMIAEAIAAGQLEFGENRVQELISKQEIFPQASWHLIGNLQRNKVKSVIPSVALLHSLDSSKLAREISRRAVEAGRVIHCLIQINISGEEQKHGMAESEAEVLLSQISKFPGLKILGLMGIPENTTDLDSLRVQFRRLRLAANEFRKFENENVKMDEISMGMSGDFEIAIAEGSTMVRIGSSIFGER